MTIRLGLATMTVLAFGVSGQSPKAPPADSSSADAAIVGVWRGELNHLPAVALTITDEGGPLAGAILFYLQQRQDMTQPRTATAGLPEPMLAPKFDGTTLQFQVSHKRAHPPGSLGDPPVPFHLRLTGPNRAMLVNDREGPALPVTRSMY